MKNLLFVLITIPLFLVSCTGDPGPPGAPGEDGEDGVNILGQIFEAEVNFIAANQFEELVVFPDNIEVFDTDIVLAYFLDGVVDGLDVWEPLPRTLYFEDGELLYGFNHTVADILFFLDGTVNLNNLPDELTRDIIIRVAILPADAAASFDLNTLSMDVLMSSLGQQEIIKVN